jgi:hypothetical protein
MKTVETCLPYTFSQHIVSKLSGFPCDDAQQVCFSEVMNTIDYHFGYRFLKEVPKLIILK